MTAILAGIILLGVLITVHEFGHFIVAKMCGVKAEVFSIGFGRPIFKFTRGDTEYRLAWIPLGGFVRLLGQDPEQTPDPADVGRSLNDKSPLIRILIFAAGPAMNLLLPFAIIIPTVALTAKYAEVPGSQVGAVDSSMPAYRAGLREGDTITAINGESVHAFWQVKKHIEKYAQDQGPVAITVSRPKQGTLKFGVTPKAIQRTDRWGFQDTDYLIGYQPSFLDSSIAVIQPDSPAGKSGLKTFDRVLSVNGKATERYIDVVDALAGIPNGQEVTLVIERLGAPVLPHLGILKKKDKHRLKFIGGSTDPASLGLRHASTCVTSVDPNGPASFLKPNDCLVSVEGQPQSLGAFLLRRLQNSPTQPKTFSWMRDGRLMKGTLSLKKRVFTSSMGDEIPYWTRGFVLPAYSMIDGKPAPSQDRWAHGWYQARTDVARNSKVIVRTIGGMFTGSVSPRQLSGPLTIFNLAGMSIKAGIETFLNLMVLVSLSVGLINLLPIPLLDGGQILVASVELVTRRPLPDRVQVALQSIGILLILALIIFALGNDVVRNWHWSKG